MPPLRYFVRGPHGDMSPALAQQFTSIFRESESYAGFRSRIESIVAGAKEEARVAEKDSLKYKIDTFAGEESAVPNYVQNLLDRMSEIKVLHLMERRKPIGRVEAQKLLSLKVRRGGPEVLRNIQETVTALLGVQIDAFEGGSHSRRGEPIAELDIDNFLVEVNGSGIREALRLVLDFEFEHPDILIVEEPEIHLHPALETSMLRYLRRISSNCQVFISTHSTNFLDTAEMRNVYLISKPDSTHIQILNLEEAEAQIPRELGIRLSSLFMYDRLVFVEGPSDEAILREWASTMGVNLSQVNAGFVAMGGVRNFTHFASEAILSFLTKRQVKMWFLVDRDERDEEEIAKLKQALGNNAIFKILTKRELENYLLCPRAIVEFIKLKRVLASSDNEGEAEAPTESDVRRILDECAEKLKQVALDKRVARILCNPVYASDLFSKGGEISIVDRVTGEIARMIQHLDERKKRTEEVYRKQAESLDKPWQKDKLAIVPGELLLDAASREFGVRFNKKREDGSRLAGLMSKDEIPDELKQIIREIGS